MKGIYDQENKGNINRHAAEDGAGRSATPGSPQTRILTTKQLCAYNPDMDNKTVSTEIGSCRHCGRAIVNKDGSGWKHLETKIVHCCDSLRSKKAEPK